MNTTSTPQTGTVTVTEPLIVRVYEATAINDHNVTLVPGTYPLEPGATTSMVTARIPAHADTRRESTALLAGVTIASREVQAREETYFLSVYRYQLDADGNYTM